ncbi:MAG TPA: aminoacyl-tRNA hydrolase [Paracoccus sp.]|nr:aminoacyl-tRNA hydrolase [Paracoccus sp. (in: a-proteobacteria)]
MRVVVGLGNPGARYARTRHNIGFLVAADLAAGSGWVDRWSAQTATLRIAGETVLIVRPQTYMNRSGDAVLALSELEGFALEETLVVFDDFLLDFGRIRLRRSGSDGGHNGLSSIIEGLRTDAVPRLRLGVGPVPESAAAPVPTSPTGSRDRCGSAGAAGCHRCPRRSWPAAAVSAGDARPAGARPAIPPAAGAGGHRNPRSVQAWRETPRRL